MNEPKYRMGYAADKLDVVARTLRLYDKFGILCPQRKNNQRLYSDYDLNIGKYIQFLMCDLGINIAGVKQLLCDLEEYIDCCNAGFDFEKIKEIIADEIQKRIANACLSTEEMEEIRAKHKRKGRKKK